MCDVSVVILQMLIKDGTFKNDVKKRGMVVGTGAKEAASFQCQKLLPPQTPGVQCGQSFPNDTAHFFLSQFCPPSSLTHFELAIIFFFHPKNWK